MFSREALMGRVIVILTGLIKDVSTEAGGITEYKGITEWYQLKLDDGDSTSIS